MDACFLAAGSRRALLRKAVRLSKPSLKMSETEQRGMGAGAKSPLRVGLTVIRN